jgi:uncharacterized membrane protein YphA (DoxX/SURF4 family)
MKGLATISRFLVGSLFIFSGLIKINDPVGTAIKLEEYFEVFASDISGMFTYFVPFALFFSVVLVVLEVLLGIAVLINFKMKTTSWILGLMIVFFTFLTFYSAYFNKVTDCGCFGDAIKLTPWESFTKDVILVFFIGIIFINRNNFSPVIGNRSGTILMSVLTVLNVYVAIYAINHLPYIDFRAYSVGSDIPKKMQVSEDLKYKYILEKDGKNFEFDTYPADANYKFKEMVLLNPEAKPKITDYSVWNDEGDFTQETFEGNKLVIITYNVQKANTSSFTNINSLVNALFNSDVEVIVLTASDANLFEQFRHEVQLAAPYYFADATVLKTIMRSNPGIMLMQNGVVQGKWHYNDVPTATEIKKLLK